MRTLLNFAFCRLCKFLKIQNLPIFSRFKRLLICWQYLYTIEVIKTFLRAYFWRSFVVLWRCAAVLCSYLCNVNIFWDYLAVDSLPPPISATKGSSTEKFEFLVFEF